MDKIIVLIIFSCDGEPTVPQVHYYHGNSTICARFCCSSGERFRSSCPVPIIIVVLPCGSSRAERLCDPSELRVRRLTPHRLGRALRSPTAGSTGSGCNPSRRISRQKRLDQAAGFSANLSVPPLSPCPRLSIVSTLMPAAASCATPPVPKKRKHSNAKPKTRTTYSTDTKPI